MYGGHGMNNEATMPTASPALLKATQVYIMAFICLLLGLAIGYMMRSSQMAVPNLQASRINPSSPAAGTASNPHRLNLEEMHVMADKKAAPLLEKLKSNPNDSALLVQIGALYHT